MEVTHECISKWHLALDNKEADLFLEVFCFFVNNARETHPNRKKADEIYRRLPNPKEES